MGIPNLTKEGLLPVGEYECTLDDITKSFGSNERRQAFCRELKKFVDEVKNLQIAKELIVNGSFTTTKDNPKDIDIFLVLKDNQHEPSAFRMLRVIFDPRDPQRERMMAIGFPSIHFFGGKKDGVRYQRITNTYRRLKDDEMKKKGFLKVKI